jgi:hypothetical protein
MSELTSLLEVIISKELKRGFKIAFANRGCDSSCGEIIDNLFNTIYDETRIKAINELVKYMSRTAQEKAVETYTQIVDYKKEISDLKEEIIYLNQKIDNITNILED